SLRWWKLSSQNLIKSPFAHSLKRLVRPLL
ncbi:putative signal transduction histidine kinase regulating citrate/malate metabolism, partial [Vibrio parahaemolyticus V-223/04]